jgi:hypothetical protein
MPGGGLQAEGKLKGIKRVAITNFCVQFVYEHMFVRMSDPLNAEFLTGNAVIDLGQASAGGKLLEQAKADMQLLEYLPAGESQYQIVGKMGPGARLWLKPSIVPQQNPFIEGLTTTTRAGCIEAMHRIFMTKITPP